MKYQALFLVLFLNFPLLTFGQELPAYSVEELAAIVERPKPSMGDFALPVLNLGKTSSDNQVVENEVDGSREVLIYRPKGTLLNQIIFAATESTSKNILYYAPEVYFNGEGKVFSYTWTRRVYDLRAGIEYVQNFDFKDENCDTLRGVSGYIIDMKTDGGLGDFVVSFDEKGQVEVEVFWSYEVDHLGRKTRGHLYLKGQYAEFREFFYQGNSKERSAIRYWGCDMDQAGKCVLKVSRVEKARE